MTREEAIKYAESKKMMLEALIYNDDCKYGNYAMCSTELSFVNAALSALCPVSREQMEMVWKGCSWCNNEGKSPENWECSLLDDRGFSVVVGDEVVWTNAEFCPICGKPLTDEAVDMLMDRLEALHD